MKITQKMLDDYKCPRCGGVYKDVGGCFKEDGTPDECGGCIVELMKAGVPGYEIDHVGEVEETEIADEDDGVE